MYELLICFIVSVFPDLTIRHKQPSVTMKRANVREAFDTRAQNGESTINYNSRTHQLQLRKIYALSTLQYALKSLIFYVVDVAVMSNQTPEIYMWYRNLTVSFGINYSKYGHFNLFHQSIPEFDSPDRETVIQIYISETLSK